MTNEAWLEGRELCLTLETVSCVSVCLRAATMRTFLCVLVLGQTFFVLVQFLLLWNLLSQLPHFVMFRLAPMPASQKSDETSVGALRHPRLCSLFLGHHGLAALCREQE